MSVRLKNMDIAEVTEIGECTTVWRTLSTWRKTWWQTDTEACTLWIFQMPSKDWEGASIIIHNIEMIVYQ